MNVRDLEHQQKLTEWSTLIDGQKHSGQTVAAWCREHNIGIRRFYYWRKQLTPSCSCSSKVNIIEPDRTSDNSFIEVTDIIKTASKCPTIRVQLRNMNIIIDYGMDNAAIQAVMRSVTAPC